MTLSLRNVSVIVALVVLAWVGYEIGRAGNDITPPRVAPGSTLKNGTIDGKRVDGRAWSLDYDTVELSPDGTQAKIAHVRDGKIHRDGKPDITVQATGVTLNTVTNDLFITGPVTLTEPLPKGARVFHTVAANYVGALKQLTLKNPATITEDGGTVTVASATIDFKTGEATFGRIEGTRSGTQP